MHTPHPQLSTSIEEGPLIYAMDLLVALEEKRADFKDDRWVIIEEIVAVREQLENFSDQYCGWFLAGNAAQLADIWQTPVPSSM
jgi:hypothetical protein